MDLSAPRLLAFGAVEPTLKAQPSMDELVRLPEREALRVYLDARNARVLFRLLYLFTAMAVVMALALLAEERYRFLALPAANLLVIRGLFSLRQKPFFARHCRALVVGFLVFQQLLILGFTWIYLPWAAFPWPIFLLPFLLVLFRLRGGALALPLAVLWGLSAGRNLVEASVTTETALAYSAIVGISLIVAAVFALVSSLTRKLRLGFLIDFRRDQHRHRERLRMQGELDDARRIQLSMLPSSEPKVPWLEVASLSIPASEVGGDYFDFFQVAEDRQAVVIGDVAGHGVASGLLLAAVRACLHMLHDTDSEPLPGPRKILEKIDRVVRQTTGRRQFITLFYALFDAAGPSLRFSAAGHPPVLRLRPGQGEVEELGFNGLPLGVRLERQHDERAVGVEPGDVFVFYTDGIAETSDGRGQVYGNERFARRLAHQGPGRSAREIRDALLGDVWSFKGDAEQTDDITLVVAKMR